MKLKIERIGTSEKWGVTEDGLHMFAGTLEECQSFKTDRYKDSESGQHRKLGSIYVWIQIMSFTVGIILGAFTDYLGGQITAYTIAIFATILAQGHDSRV